MRDLNKLFSNIRVKGWRTMPSLLPTTIHAGTPSPRGNYSLSPVITTIKLDFFIFDFVNNKRSTFGTQPSAITYDGRSPELVNIHSLQI